MDKQRNRVVNFAVCGKFHSVNHIPYLRKSGYLNRFYYSHPRHVETGTEQEYVRLPLKEYLIQGHSRITGAFLETMDAVYSNIWTRSVLKRWDPAPILHFLILGHCLPLISRAKHDGARIIAGAISTHPENRRAIMEAETEKWKLPNLYKKLSRHEARINEEVASSDLLLVPSRHVAETYRKHSTPSRVAVLPFATNTIRFKPSSTRSSRGTTGPLRVMTVGQIGLRKGQLYVLEALSRFPPGSIDMTLVGTIDPIVRSLLSKYGHHFRHIPRIPNQDLVELYQNLDVYILASLEEGLAGSMCEAIGCGVAVACTPETGIEEIVEDRVTGYVINSRSVEAIEEFLTFALANRRELIDVGLAAAANAKNGANWESYANHLMRIYDEILEGQEKLSSTS